MSFDRTKEFDPPVSNSQSSLAPVGVVLTEKKVSGLQYVNNTLQRNNLEDFLARREWIISTILGTVTPARSLSWTSCPTCGVIIRALASFLISLGCEPLPDIPFQASF
ncbi:MAG: hypothetical protein CL912_11570 [Deltaproteobacteria bacterium]|nr:hypothetical protein [Deltaproteobacteria bacterium]